MRGGGVLNSASSSISGAASSLRDAAKDAAADAAAALKAADLAARQTGESAALATLFFPPSFITWYQNQRAALGFEPPTLAQLPMIVIIIPMVIAIIVGIVYREIMATTDIAQKAAEGKKTTQFQNIFFIFMCLIIFTLVITGIFFWFGPGLKVSTNLSETQKAIGARTGFQNAIPPPSESSFKLVNIQPLSIKQTGFVGPDEKDGVFDPTLGIQTAIRSGVSFFTFQIDYLEREQDSTKFDAINIPTLLYRDSSGKLISKNGASIKNTAEQLATYAFSPDLGASNYPIILYLHFVKTPDPAKKPTEYLNFLMNVSEALKPLHSYFLKGSVENFRRQRGENSLLHLPLTSISNSIILMSNADTTIFRNPHATGKVISPTSDLDSFINMRVYMDSGSDSIGVTQPAVDAKASAILISYRRLKNMSAADRTTFVTKGKNRFVIAMPSQLENPTYAELKSILNDTGVNVIPLNLIGPDPEPINKIISLWSSSRPYYMLKQMMLQSYTTSVRPNES